MHERSLLSTSQHLTFFDNELHFLKKKNTTLKDLLDTSHLLVLSSSPPLSSSPHTLQRTEQDQLLNTVFTFLSFNTLRYSPPPPPRSPHRQSPSIEPSTPYLGSSPFLLGKSLEELPRGVTCCCSPRSPTARSTTRFSKTSRIWMLSSSSLRLRRVVPTLLMRSSLPSMLPLCSPHCSITPQ
jgi:hypothetical protein